MTVLILAIGFLGLAGLQLTALQQNTSAYERSQATMLAYDIIDRMRANRGAVTGGNYTTAIGDAPTASSCKGTGANCAASDMAAYDINLWKCSLGFPGKAQDCQDDHGIVGKLANGDGSISIAGDIVTITIQWEDQRAQETAAAKLTSITVRTSI